MLTSGFLDFAAACSKEEKLSLIIITWSNVLIFFVGILEHGVRSFLIVELHLLEFVLLFFFLFTIKIVIIFWVVEEIKIYIAFNAYIALTLKCYVRNAGKLFLA